jgi:hypothetical protein
MAHGMTADHTLPGDDLVFTLHDGDYHIDLGASRAKPWRRHYIADALCGYSPDTASKLFWSHVERSIEIFDRWRRHRLAGSLRIAAANGRFHRRA